MLYLIFSGFVLIIFIGVFLLLKRKFFEFSIFSLQKYRLLSIKLPSLLEEKEKFNLKEELKKVSEFLEVLGGKKINFCFEIAQREGKEEIEFFVAVPKNQIEFFQKAAEGFWPQIQTELVLEDFNIFNPKSEISGVFLKLKKDWEYPIRFFDEFEKDPQETICSSLTKLKKEGEGACIQMIFKPLPASYNGKIKYVVSGLKEGKKISEIKKSFFKEFFDLLFFQKPKKSKDLPQKEIDQELIDSLSKKADSLLFAVNLRLVVSSQNKIRSNQILSDLISSFEIFNSPLRNSFKAISPKKILNFIFEFSWRKFSKTQKIILSSKEIASFWHPPISTEIVEVKKARIKELPPPAELLQDGLILGKNIFRGRETIIKISDDDRRRHIYLVGQTGTGKSNLLIQMAGQDIQNGKGVAFLDPHGDAIYDLLSLVPKERVDDVIYFDPSHPKYALGLNFLEFDRNYPEQKTFIANEMIQMFYRLFSAETMGPVFEQYMRNSLLLLMEDSKEVSTIVEIPKVLTDSSFREEKLSRCQNPVVYNFWKKEAEEAGGEFALSNMAPYITSKLNVFISNDYLRPIIGQKNSFYDFKKLIDSKKIFLVNLSKGKIGETNAYLLGMIFVSKIFMASLSRVDVAQEKRIDFYLYIDEFQNFCTETISSILSEARKYRLNLILAHQYIAQLPEKIREAIFGNVGSQVVFRIGAQDAEFLIKEFEPYLKTSDLISIDNFWAYVKLMIKGKTSPPFNINTFPPKEGNLEQIEFLKQKSFERYGKLKEEIEKDIKKRLI